jgi:hypothetical protein
MMNAEMAREIIRSRSQTERTWTQAKSGIGVPPLAEPRRGLARSGVASVLCAVTWFSYCIQIMLFSCGSIRFSHVHLGLPTASAGFAGYNTDRKLTRNQIMLKPGFLQRKSVHRAITLFSYWLP